MAAPAFGLLCCGRSVQTDYQTIDETKIAFTIPNVVDVKHVAVFLTGSIQLPPGTAAAVYFVWLNEEGVVSNKYLGYVANEKPSSLFRLNKFHHPATTTGQQNFMSGVAGTVASSAQIGISLEPIDTVKNYTSDQAADHHNEFSQFCAENLYNYMSSFAKPLSSVCPGSLSNEVVVPVQAVIQWYQKFSERLKANPTFWKS